MFKFLSLFSLSSMELGKMLFQVYFRMLSVVVVFYFQRLDLREKSDKDFQHYVLSAYSVGKINIFKHRDTDTGSLSLVCMRDPKLSKH